MTREEQIKKAAEEYVSGSINDEWEEALMYNSFIAGAEWADKTSNDKTRTKILNG